jgi:DNA-binding transcriptional regulator YhcF (GntR family)
MNHKINKKISETVSLADRLVEDIRFRNLQPGDIYLTTHDARKLLGVGGTAANHAMQLLEKRRIIKRTQRRGSIVLSPPQSSQTSISRIHILVPELYYRTEGFGNDGILFGLQGMFPLANVSHCLLSQDGNMERVDRLIHQTITEGGTDAFILASVSFEIQRLIAQTGFPTVVYGTTYHGIGNLPQLERDQRGSVIQLVEYFRRCGTNQIAVLMRQHIMPGDQVILNTIFSVLGVSSPIRFVASDQEHTIAEVHIILRENPSVNAFLCQTTKQAEAVLSALELEKRPTNNIKIGALLSFAKRNEPQKFTHLQLVPTPEEIGIKLAELLQEQVLGHVPKNKTIPVKLVVI